ncbi:TylF/MycF family methyltransferase [Campylobacter jejuni]|nr:TylF/MycF family methyltransferase [Campylobacter jejuni]MCW1563327.1 TylF/MycF family methyltransferase [Campylobacter jejuni]MCW1669389.1 TylF/MycF family methyltransferase [Campylobacter jejuni]
MPEYCDKHPEFKIAFLHIDVDIYEPTVTILENLFDKVVRGG